jgi:hypothetical protein
MYTVLFLKYRSQLRPDLLMQKYMSENDEKNIIKLLKRDGRKEKNFALDVLNFFVQKISGLENEDLTETENKNSKDENSDGEVNENENEEDEEEDER